MGKNEMTLRHRGILLERAKETTLLPIENKPPEIVNNPFKIEGKTSNIEDFNVKSDINQESPKIVERDTAEDIASIIEPPIKPVEECTKCNQQKKVSNFVKNRKGARLKNVI